MTPKTPSHIGWQNGPPRVAKAMSERFKNPVFSHVEMLQSDRKSIKKAGFLGAFPRDTVLSIFPRTHRRGEKGPKQGKTEEIRGGVCN